MGPPRNEAIPHVKVWLGKSVRFIRTNPGDDYPLPLISAENYHQ